MFRISWVWVVLVLLAFGGYWQYRHSDKALMKQAAAANPNGFVQVFMPDDAPENTVLVFAAANCPKEDAQRARRLLDELRTAGVPARLQSSYRLTSVPSEPDTERRLQQLNAVMRGTIPAVLIGGMGKANPTADEVISEYRRQRGRHE